MIDPRAVYKAFEENEARLETPRHYVPVCTCHYTRIYACPVHKESTVTKPKIDEFKTGATRDASATKPDFEGFMSPLVLHAYGRFMQYNREMEDGSLRESDNWQLGIPLANYMKSLWRHHVDLHLHHRGRGYLAKQTLVWTLCAIIFNASGYLHELLKHDDKALDEDEKAEVQARKARRAEK